MLNSREIGVKSIGFKFSFDEDDDNDIPYSFLSQFSEIASLMSIKSICLDAYYESCKKPEVCMDVGENYESCTVRCILKKYFENRHCAFKLLMLVLKERVLFTFSKNRSPAY